MDLAARARFRGEGLRKLPHCNNELLRPVMHDEVAATPDNDLAGIRRQTSQLFLFRLLDAGKLQLRFDIPVQALGFGRDDIRIDPVFGRKNQEGKIIQANGRRRRRVEPKAHDRYFVGNGTSRIATVLDRRFRGQDFRRKRRWLAAGIRQTQQPDNPES